LPADGSEITIRLRRSHLWAIGAGLVGALLCLAIGFLIGRASADDPQPVLYGLPATQGDAGAGGAASEPTPPAEPVQVDVMGAPAQGPADAKVTMVEFVDFECPFCGRYARDTLPRLRREYGDRIRYVSRQFPLEIHPNAERAALAAECAGEQGRYWPFHELLFKHQDALGKPDLAGYARQVGLDMDRYERCIHDPDTEARVQRDIADGRRYGVTGTPAFFINGRLVSGAQPFAQFKAALDAELEG
jgi:protein-disulfide isomerase